MARRPVTVLRGHHVSAIKGAQLYDTDELIEGFREAGYNNPEAMRPAIEELKDLIRDENNLVRFELGTEDNLCKVCEGASEGRCPSEDKDPRLVDRSRLKGYGLMPGKNYTIKQVLKNIDKKIAEREAMLRAS